MITWVQKRFSDRTDSYTETAEIDLWLHNLPGEVKHFSMIPLGTLVLAVAGYEPRPEDIVYLPPKEEAQAIENFMESFVND